MDATEMTPEELRLLAARKEAVSLHRSHIPEDERPPLTAVVCGREPWSRDVEVDGVTYRVDMRRLKSRKFMRMAVAANADDAPLSLKLDLFDYVFEPEEGQILDEVTRRVGYEDFEVYYDICAKLFEAVGAKN